MVTLQIVPYAEIAELSSLGRIRKLLSIAKENKIVLLQGKLAKEEEAEMIKITMEEINKDFKGIELAVVEPEKETLHGLGLLRENLVGMLLGNRQGLTVIGPANIVTEIKKDPRKIELLTKEIRTPSKPPKPASKKGKKR